MEHLDTRRKLTIIFSVMSAMLFAALNQTIIGTALPRIVSSLGGMEYFNWIFTIYMLASSMTAILVGKLSDIYGRKRFILIGIGVFFFGSLLCGLSNSIMQLIAYRGIQGFGAGMIFSTSFASIGDLFSPRERGRWQGLMGSVFGLASIFGPTLGGFIVDNADWHWIFWIFLPFGVLAFVLIWMLFPSTPQKVKEPIDYLGSLFLIMTMVPLLLAFSWAGTKYAWGSDVTLGLFMASLAAFICFVRTEHQAASPVLPLSLFKNRIFSVSHLSGFTMGAGMFGAIMYMPFFVQGVLGTSATGSGFVVMPMMVSMVVSSALTGQRITKTGRYKHFALLGLLLMMTGMTGMAMMDTETANTTAMVHMIIVGLGLGCAFPVFNLTIQNAVEHKYLGVATASTQLFRQMGGTIGVSLFGTVMNSRMEVKLSEVSPNLDPQLPELNPEMLMDQEVLSELKLSIPPEAQDSFIQSIGIMREALSYSLSAVFLCGALVTLLSFLFTFLIEEIPLRQTNHISPKAEEHAG
jgi:EmrB/QacA subfamily drug resistance transporter